MLKIVSAFLLHKTQILGPDPPLVIILAHVSILFSKRSQAKILI